MELAQLGPGIDAEFLGEDAARLPVRIERFRMAAGAVEGLHEQQPQVFPQRIVGQQPAQLRDDLGVAAAGQLGLDPEFGGVETEIGQPPGFRLDQCRRRGIGQRAAVPERERLGQLGRRTLGIPGGISAPALAHEGLEHLGVAIPRGQPQQVTGSTCDQEGTVSVTEEPAQPQHVDADQVGRLRRRALPPYLVDQHVDGNDLPGIDQKGSQDRTPLRGPDPLPVSSGPDLQGSEQPEPHHYPGSLASG